MEISISGNATFRNSTNRNVVPARSASPATTRLADAPISVPLPPRQAPERQRPPQRQQRVLAAEGRSHRLDQRDHRRDERNVVDERRQDRRPPQDRERRQLEIAAGRLQQRVGHQVDESGFLDAEDQDEQAEEEHQRDPLGLRQRAVDVLRLRLGVLPEVVEQQQHRRAEDGDRRRLDVGLPLQHEPDDHQRDHRERLLQEPRVGDRLALVEAHHVPPVLVGRPQVPAPEEVERDHRRDEDRR